MPPRARTGRAPSDQDGAARQRQSQNSARLLFRQTDLIAVTDDRARIGDERDQRHHITRWPIARDQAFTRHTRIGALANELNHVIDVGDGNGETNGFVTALARFCQPKLGPARHHLFAEGDEDFENLPQAHLFGLTLVQRQHVDAERSLQLRVSIKLVQHDIRHGVALQLNDQAHAETV